MTTRTWPVHVATLGPIHAGTKLWRLGGRPHLTIAIKACFALVSESEARLVAPEPVGDGDLSPYLPAAEVVVLGARPEAGGRRRLLVAGEHPLVDKATPAGGPGSFGPEPGPDRALLAEPIADVPQGFDWARLHAAPPDQRGPFLRGNEWIVLEGLVPGSPLLRTRLPDVAVTAQIAGLGAPVHVKLRLDTLEVDAAKRRLVLLWRGFVALPGEVAPGELRARAAVTLAGRTVEETLVVAASPAAAHGLPFAGPAAAPAPPPSAPGRGMPGAPWSRESGPARVDPASFDGTLNLTSFASSRGGEDLGGTVAGSELPSAPVLPFEGRAPATTGAARDASPSRLPGAPWASGAAAKPPPPSAFDGTLNLTAAVAELAKGEPPAAPPAVPAVAPPRVEPVRVEPPRAEERPVEVREPPRVEAPRVVEEQRVEERRVEERADAPPAPARPAPPRPAAPPRKSATQTLYTGFGPRKK